MKSKLIRLTTLSLWANTVFFKTYTVCSPSNLTWLEQLHTKMRQKMYFPRFSKLLQTCRSKLLMEVLIHWHECKSIPHFSYLYFLKITKKSFSLNFINMHCFVIKYHRVCGDNVKVHVLWICLQWAASPPTHVINYSNSRENGLVAFYFRPNFSQGMGLDYTLLLSSQP